MFLTSFLVIGGAFTFWCSLKNYDWFFNAPGLSKTFINAVGRPFARGFYLIFSIPLLVWGISRVVDPPPLIPTEFIYELASPSGIDLTSKTASKQLANAGEIIFDLDSGDQDWNSFWIELLPESPYFEHASASAVAGPDFQEGFNFGPKSAGGATLQGVVLYFDANLRSCNNMLFSDRPLKSAHFAMVICDIPTSKRNEFESGLGVFFCRAGTTLYEDAIR